MIGGQGPCQTRGSTKKWGTWVGMTVLLRGDLTYRNICAGSLFPSRGAGLGALHTLHTSHMPTLRGVLDKPRMPGPLTFWLMLRKVT